jgi:hypothetical protein
VWNAGRQISNTRTCSVSFYFCPSSLPFSVIFFLLVLPTVLLFISAYVFRFYSHYFSYQFCYLSFFLFPVLLSSGFFPLCSFSIFTPFFLSLLPLFPVFYLFFSSIHTYCHVPFILSIICLLFYVSLLHVYPNCFMLFWNDSGNAWVLTNPPGCMKTRVAALSKSNTRRSLSPCPLNSVRLSLHFLSAQISCRNLHQYNIAVGSFTRSTFECSYCGTVQFKIGFVHKAWSMTRKELAT